MNHSINDRLDALFSDWKTGICPGAQVLIRHHGKTVYENCFGYGNLENKIPITPDSIFHVASISKQFTVLSVLLLWKSGKLSLDDDIRTYVGELIHFEEPVTIRQMINNVSGLRDQWELLFLRGITINDAIGMEDINTAVRLQKHLNFAPQTDYMYSNTGFHLLAVITERISGMSFPEFVKRNIFEPLGMTHSFIRESFAQVVPNLVYSYQDDGDGSFFYNPLNYMLYGPTSVNTCAADLVKILDEYIRPNVIDPEIIAFMKTPAVLQDGTPVEYCGGLMTHKLHDLTVWGHGGADAAYRGQVSCIPEEELEIIILSNTNGKLVAKLAKKAACIVLNLEDCTEPQLPAFTPSVLRSGLYATNSPDDPMFVHITEQNGSCFMEREHGMPVLTRRSDGGYSVGSLDEALYFSEEALFYRLPARILRLTPVHPADPSLFCEGRYYNAETDAWLSVVKENGIVFAEMTRYGKTPILQNAEGRFLFGFNPDFCMYLKVEHNTLLLDGYRVRGICFEPVS